MRVCNTRGPPVAVDSRMPAHCVILRGTTHVFGSLRELMAKAPLRRSGDELARVGAANAVERAAAQHALAADVPLAQFLAVGKIVLIEKLRSIDLFLEEGIDAQDSRAAVG